MLDIGMPDTNGQRLFRAFKKIKQQGRHVKPVAGLRMSEFVMMHCIWHRLSKDGDTQTEDEVDLPGATISELSEMTHQTLSGASQIIKALEEKEMVERSVSPSDRRLVYVNLSEKGWKIIHEQENAFYHSLEKITDALGEEDTNQLIALLDKLVVILKDMKGEPTP